MISPSGHFPHAYTHAPYPYHAPKWSCIFSILFSFLYSHLKRNGVSSRVGQRHFFITPSLCSSLILCILEDFTSKYFWNAFFSSSLLQISSSLVWTSIISSWRSPCLQSFLPLFHPLKCWHSEFSIKQSWLCHSPWLKGFSCFPTFKLGNQIWDSSPCIITSSQFYLCLHFWPLVCRLTLYLHVMFDTLRITHRTSFCASYKLDR